MNFQIWLESKTNPVVYHITYYRNLDSINDNGLDYQDYGGANFEKNHLIQNSRNGNFFTTDIKQIHNWLHVLEYQANDKSDNIYEDGLIPIILKFNINRNSFNIDQHSEYPKSYFTRKIINPQSIFCWNGSGWIPIYSWERISLDKFVDYIDEDGGYYELNQYYPLPN